MLARVQILLASLLLFGGVARAEDLFGAALAGPGDLDGDGLPDLAVADPWDAGRFGRGPGRLWALSGVDGALLWQLAGKRDAERFGSSLAAAGDLDKDGVGDLLVGAAGGPGLPGALVAVSGRRGESLWRVDLQAGDYLLPWWTAGASPALASVADLDGDGLRDVLVGQAFATGPDGALQAGHVQLLSGASGARLAERDGSGPGQRLGAALAGLGDVDGDGLHDVVVSALPRTPESGAPGSATLWLLSGADLDELARRDSSDQRLGLALAPSHDHDGDGQPDLLVGRPFAHGDEPPLLLLSGHDLASLRSFAPRGGPSFAASLGVRGPQLPPARGLLVGAPRAFVPDGGPGAWWLPFDDATPALELVGCNNDPACRLGFDSHFGVALVELGDLDADGVAEFAVGSASIRGKSGFPGALRVFDGGSGRSRWHKHLADL